MYFIIALSLAVLGFFFPPLWLVAVIFFAASVLSSVGSTSKGIGEAIGSAIIASQFTECKTCYGKVNKKASICPHCNSQLKETKEVDTKMYKDPNNPSILRPVEDRKEDPYYEHKGPRHKR